MLSLFPRGVLGEILNLIESVSEGFPSYSSKNCQKRKPQSGGVVLDAKKKINIPSYILVS